MARQLSFSWQGTKGSNPSPSSGEFINEPELAPAGGLSIGLMTAGTALVFIGLYAGGWSG